MRSERHFEHRSTWEHNVGDVSAGPVGRLRADHPFISTAQHPARVSPAPTVRSCRAHLPQKSLVITETAVREMVGCGLNLGSVRSLSAPFGLLTSGATDRFAGATLSGAQVMESAKGLDNYARP